MDNGVGQPSGGYEEIVWDDNAKTHEVGLTDIHTRTRLASRRLRNSSAFHDLTLEMNGHSRTSMEASHCKTFYIRSMHRMYIEAR